MDVSHLAQNQVSKKQKSAIIIVIHFLSFYLKNYHYGKADLFLVYNSVTLAHVWIHVTAAIIGTQRFHRLPRTPPCYLVVFPHS